jgi:hypothetical protein
MRSFGLERPLGLVLALCAAPVLADRLPLKGDSWIETRGRWTVAGERVVFTTADGALRSLALAETALGDAPLAGADATEGGFAVSFGAWPTPAALPEIRPLPAPAPSPGRQAPRVVPVGCRLVTEEPGDAPRFVCPEALEGPDAEPTAAAPR